MWYFSFPYRVIYSGIWTRLRFISVKFNIFPVFILPYHIPDENVGMLSSSDNFRSTFLSRDETHRISGVVTSLQLSKHTHTHTQTCYNHYRKLSSEQESDVKMILICFCISEHLNKNDFYNFLWISYWLTEQYQNSISISIKFWVIFTSVKQFMSKKSSYFWPWTERPQP